MAKGANQYTGHSDLLARFWEKVEIPRFPNGAPDFDACWRWIGGFSRSGRRQTKYPSFWVGSRGVGWMYRAHRLALILKTTPNDPNFPDARQRPGESVSAWLQRANGVYKDLEAAHSCDHSWCANGFHLSWETHTDNVANQWSRQQEIEAAHPRT